MGISAITYECHLHAFVGVNVTVVTAKDTYISDSNSQYSALFAIHDVNLTIYDSSFTNLNLAEVQAPVALDRSAITILNTEFLNNTAPLSGGIASSVMNNLTLSNCTFNNNYGESDDLLVSALRHDIAAPHHSSAYSRCEACPYLYMYKQFLHLELRLLQAGSQAGAVLVNGSTDACSRGTGNCSLTIHNSTFANNMNTAVYLVTDGFDFDLQRSTFIGNSAADQGGAIVLGSLQSNNTNISKPLKATLTASTFSGNTAGKQGGAVLISNQANLRAFICTLTDVSAFNNSAGQLGGGFWYQQVSTLQIVSSSFTQNFISNGTEGAAAAGAFWITASCAASVNAQSIYSAAPFVCSLAITNSSFSNNTAPLNGGAFASRLDGYAVAISQSTFAGNQITAAGGAGAAFSMTPLITGGGLSTLLVMSQSNFTGNVASDALGCLSVQQVACIAIQSCIFDSNTASTGGAIFTTQVNSDESNCFNQALALQTIPRPLLDAPALFDPLSPGPAPEAASENSSEPEAATEPFSPVILDIRGSHFLNNSATGTTGGAMALGSVINAAAIVNCTFLSNTSPDVGGAITIFSNALVTVAGTSFVANQAPSAKGVVYHFSQPLGVVSLAVTDSNFTDNIGTALVGDNSYVEINSSRFVNNSAGATGAGAIYVESLSRLLLNDCEFVNNTSLDSGGAIQTSSQDPAGIVLQGVTAYNNRCSRCLSVCLSVCLPACLPACVSVCLCLSLSLLACLPICCLQASNYISILLCITGRNGLFDPAWLGPGRGLCR